MFIEAKKSATFGVMSEARGESRRRRRVALSRPPQSSTLLFLFRVGAVVGGNLAAAAAAAAAALSQGEISEFEGEISQPESESRDLGGHAFLRKDEGRKGSAEVLDFI